MLIRPVGLREYSTVFNENTKRPRQIFPGVAFAFPEENEISDKGGLSSQNMSALNEAAAQDHLLRGNVQYAACKWAEAIQEYSRAITLNPNFSFAFRNRGISWHKLRDYDQAIKDLDKAIRLDSKYAEAYCSRGLVYAAQGNDVLAMRNLDEAVRLDQTSASYYNRGHFHCDKGRYDQGIGDYTKAIQLNSTDAGAYVNRALAYHWKDDNDKAVQDLDEAIRLNPKLARAYSNRGVVHTAKENYHLAIRDFETAIQLEPRAKTYRDLGYAYEAIGNYDHADFCDYQAAILDGFHPPAAQAKSRSENQTEEIANQGGAANEIFLLKNIGANGNPPQHYQTQDLLTKVNNLLEQANALMKDGLHLQAVDVLRETVKICPNEANIHASLGYSLAQTGQHHQAVKACQEAIRLDPKDARLHDNLGYSLAQTGQHYQAINPSQEAIRLNPKNANYHYNLGHALTQTGQHQPAIEAFREAIRLNPKEARYHHNLGTALAWTGQHQPAIEAFQEAIRLNPKNTRSHHNLGNALTQTGQHDQAIKSYQEAIRLDPKNAGSHYKLGLCLKEKGEHEQALQKFQKARELEPENADAHYNIGFYLEALGDLDGAFKCFDETIRLNPQHAEAYYERGLLQKDPSKTFNDFNQAVSLDPTNSRAWLHRGIALSTLGKVSASERDFKHALKLEPELAPEIDEARIKINAQIEQTRQETNVPKFDLKSYLQSLPEGDLKEHFMALFNRYQEKGTRGMTRLLMKARDGSGELTTLNFFRNGLNDLIQKGTLKRSALSQKLGWDLNDIGKLLSKKLPREILEKLWAPSASGAIAEHEEFHMASEQVIDALKEFGVSSEQVTATLFAHDIQKKPVEEQKAFLEIITRLAQEFHPSGS